MNNRPAPSAPDNDLHLTRQLAVLRELVDQGMDLARRLHVEALAATTPASLVAVAMDRHTLIARGIRHAVALEAYLLRTRTTRIAHAARAEAALHDRRRDYLRERVDGAITKAGGQTHPQRIRLAEHLANPGLDAQFASRPFDHIVASICRDLGIPPPPPLATPSPDPPNRAHEVIGPEILGRAIDAGTRQAQRPAPPPDPPAPMGASVRHACPAHATGPP